MSKAINLQVPSSFIGPGAIDNIGELVKRFKSKSTLVITDPGIVKSGVINTVREHLDKANCKYDVFDNCEIHPTLSFLVSLGDEVRRGKYDLLIGVGGGSIMDSTKVAGILAANDGKSVYDFIGFNVVQQNTPRILIPTTAGTGSEWSIFAVVYDDKANKMTKLVISPQNIPDAVIIDPVLTLSLPQRITADTGMDALTHAIEAYVSAQANIISDMLASTAIKLIAENLRRAYSKGDRNLEARGNMSIAASLAMLAGSVASVGLVHYLNEPLGERAHVTHGTACTLLLPHVMSFNLIANPEKFAKIAELMGENINGLPALEAAPKAIESVRRLANDLAMPRVLSEAAKVTLTEADISEMAEEIHTKLGPYINETNPRNVTPKDSSKILSLVL